MKKLNFIKSIRLVLVTSLLLQLFISNSYSQNYLFNYITYEDLTNDEQANYTKLITLTQYSRIDLISTNPLSSIIDNQGSILIDIPGDSCNVLSFSPLEVNYLSDSNYSFYGKTENDTCDCNCYSGDIIILKDSLGTYGSLSVQKDFYEIRTLGNASALCKLNTNNYQFPDCPDSIQNSNNNLILEEPENFLSSRSPNCEIRVLFLYSNKAELASNINEIMAKSNQIIYESNLALKNSEMFDFGFKLVGLEKLITFTENININPPPSNANEDMYQLVDNNAEWKNKRDFYHADLVVLFTNGSYGDLRGTSGSHKVNNVIVSNAHSPKEELGIAMVQINNSSPWVGTHELGHLFGCQHQPQSVDGSAYQEYYPPVHPHFMEFQKCLFWILCEPKWAIKTMMMPLPAKPSAIRTLIFSNPLVKFNNKATGIDGERDHVTWLKQVGCSIVSNYSTSPPCEVNLNIATDLPDNICENHYKLVVANFACLNNVSFKWYESTDGVYYGQIAGTNSQFYAYGTPGFKRKYIKLIMKDNLTNIEYVAFKSMPIIEELFHFCTRNNIIDDKNQVFYISSLKVEQDFIRIYYSNLIENAKIKVSIINLQGIIISEDLNISNQSNVIYISTISLITGTYLCRITGPNSLEYVYKFIKT